VEQERLLGNLKSLIIFSNEKRASKDARFVLLTLAILEILLY
jgi:hypothetical protein